MIKNIKALDLGEVGEILKKYPQLEENKVAENGKEYSKKFMKVKYEKTEKLKESLRELGLDKLKEKNISKIIDLMPEDPEDLKKVFIGEDFSLEQEEINSILEKIKSVK